MALFNQTKVLRTLKQTGRKPKSLRADMSIKALKPGKRKTAWGTFYWEGRRNRSDAKPRNYPYPSL